MANFYRVIITKNDKRSRRKQRKKGIKLLKSYTYYNKKQRRDKSTVPACGRGMLGGNGISAGILASWNNGKEI